MSTAKAVEMPRANAPVIKRAKPAKPTEVKKISERWQSRSGQIFTRSWMAATAIVILWGWGNRFQGYLTPERGLGYWLGIVGGVSFLLLLTYSMRKRMKSMRRIFTVKLWFQLHMALGVVGTLLILFHSNFKLGSLNSTIALVCVLAVSGSGIIGRYLYSRVHFGLYGEKIKLKQVLNDFQVLKRDMADVAVTDKQKAIMEKLVDAIESLIEDHQKNDNPSIFKLYANRRRAHKIAIIFKEFARRLEEYHGTRTDSRNNTMRMRKKLHEDCSILLIVLRKLPGLQFFERLFSLWHVIHIPMFGLMIITAITHVVVVHMY